MNEIDERIDERNDEEMIQIMRKVRQFEESWPPSSEEHLQVKASLFLTDRAYYTHPLQGPHSCLKQLLLHGNNPTLKPTDFHTKRSPFPMKRMR